MGFNAKNIVSVKQKKFPFDRNISIFTNYIVSIQDRLTDSQNRICGGLVIKVTGVFETLLEDRIGTPDELVWDKDTSGTTFCRM